MAGGDVPFDLASRALLVGLPHLRAQVFVHQPAERGSGRDARLGDARRHVLVEAALRARRERGTVREHRVEGEVGDVAGHGGASGPGGVERDEGAGAQRGRPQPAVVADGEHGGGAVELKAAAWRRPDGGVGRRQRRRRRRRQVMGECRRWDKEGRFGAFEGGDVVGWHAAAADRVEPVGAGAGGGAGPDQLGGGSPVGRQHGRDVRRDAEPQQRLRVGPLLAVLRHRAAHGACPGPRRRRRRPAAATEARDGCRADAPPHRRRRPVVGGAVGAWRQLAQARRRARREDGARHAGRPAADLAVPAPRQRAVRVPLAVAAPRGTALTLAPPPRRVVVATHVGREQRLAVVGRCDIPLHAELRDGRLRLRHLLARRPPLQRRLPPLYLLLQGGARRPRGAVRGGRRRPLPVRQVQRDDRVRRGARPEVGHRRLERRRELGCHGDRRREMWRPLSDLYTILKRAKFKFSVSKCVSVDLILTNKTSELS